LAELEYGFWLIAYIYWRVAMFFRAVRLICLIVAVTFAGSATAQEMGNADEATALVKKGIAFYKAQGKEKAFAAFADPNGGFQSKDLYVFVQDMKGLMLAHGKNAGLNGKDLSGLKDSDGKLFVAEMIKVVGEKGSGWVDYKWVNATSKKIEPKSSYVEKVDDMFFGAGIYKH
jgi:cytochrome c